MEAVKNNRYIRIDQGHAQTIQPFIQQSRIVQYPEGWESGLSPDEFLVEAKKMLKKKFDDKN